MKNIVTVKALKDISVGDTVFHIVEVSIAEGKENSVPNSQLGYYIDTNSFAEWDARHNKTEYHTSDEWMNVRDVAQYIIEKWFR